jgi:CheY-like chemotaxis protein
VGDSGAVAFYGIEYIGRVTESASYVPTEQIARPLVIVVDDEPALRKLMGAALEGHYRVLLAEDGAGALRLFGGTDVENIAAVVTDIRMPGMDGLALAAAIRERGIEVPILFVSGFSVIGHAPGPRLAKPFSPNDLLAAVQDLLSSTPDSGQVH